MLLSVFEGVEDFVDGLRVHGLVHLWYVSGDTDKWFVSFGFICLCLFF